MRKIAAALVALASCLDISVMAEEKKNDKIEELRDQGYKVHEIAPIFDKVMMPSFPKGFKTVFEKTTNDNRYIRESVLDGETVDQWSQMITVTGAKGLTAHSHLNAGRCGLPTALFPPRRIMSNMAA
jgi:hypothetical protein